MTLKRILLVDDRPCYTIWLIDLLEIKGCETKQVQSVDEAEKYLFWAQLIISDLMMPGRLGTELIGKRLPIIFNTASPECLPSNVPFFSAFDNNDDRIKLIEETYERFQKEKNGKK